jgi:DNA-binding MarR family transcriptional regulator
MSAILSLIRPPETQGQASVAADNVALHHTTERRSGQVATTHDVDELADAFLKAAPTLMAVALRSVNASPVEVTLTQHGILMILASSGEESVGALAEQLGVNASNASRACDRLERLGLVARHRSARDARSVQVGLTEAGVEVLRVVSEHRHEAVRRILSSVGSEIAEDAVEALRAFDAAAQEVAVDNGRLSGGTVSRWSAVGP